MTQIAIYGKGGIGKSTISANISAALAMAGKRVLQAGCDPKHDSTRLLLRGARITTVLEYLKSTSPDKCRLEDIIFEGAFGVHCVESGGPEPGVGCAGRGILTTFDLLERLGLKNRGYDAVLYDVLGDVVCGGFAVPIRGEYADKVYIVTSGEFMSIYAANNILRGLRNYDAGKNRAGGIIYNSRGIQEEDRRIYRFSEAVSLPVLETIPRDDIFSQAEKLGVCVMEAYPDSELAAKFRALADRIFSQTFLFESSPVTDEELERHVLETPRAVCASAQAAAPVQAPAPEKQNAMFSKNLISREPLHGCAYSGAMGVCVQLGGAVCVSHGPDSCAHITYQSLTSIGRKMMLERGIVLPLQVSPPVISSGMNESVMIFGGLDNLRDAINRAKAKNPQIICVLGTCPAGIIGDDIDAVCQDDTVIPIRTDGNIQGDYLQGILLAYTAIAKSLIDRNAVPEEMTVNIIAEKPVASATRENFEYIGEILAMLGLRVNCRFLCETTVDDVRGLLRGRLNLLAYEDYMGRCIRDFLIAEYDAEFLNMPFPVGFQDSCAWVREVAGHFGQPELADGIIAEYKRRYDREIAKIKPYLKGKRFMIVTLNHNIEWILQTALDLEMRLEFAGILNYSQDDRFSTQFESRISELVVGYDHAKLNSDLERIRPDILIANYNSTERGEGVVMDTIPLCPAVGFLSGVHLAARWGELFRMNLKEGWKTDRELYGKYYA